MTDQLEQNLREALSDRAAQLDPDLDRAPARDRLPPAPAPGPEATCVRCAWRHRHGCGGGRHRRPRLERRAGVRWLAGDADHPGPGPAHPGGTGMWARLWESGPDRLARSVHGRDLRQLGHASDVCLERQRGLDVLQLHLGGARQRSRPARSSSVAVARGTPPATRLTLVDGRIGAGVTAVTIELQRRQLRAGDSRQRLVPGVVARQRRGDQGRDHDGCRDQHRDVPVAPALPALTCPSGAHCAAGYAYDSGSGSHSGSVSAGGSAGGSGSVSGSVSGNGAPPAGQATTGVDSSSVNSSQ